ncbi:MAG: hypothetical protein A3G76_07765 [Acidobacteria bacterium RIFCSPLOWO2_12_FULL_65_11]|nr:MAG: hypothetical protein A3H95_01065 [Acidobacteria bacterium RIFCSPLOWO2_02_FULL_64_15]OFW31823.1 MAG: hypothetical protein A3G76_07765 [Acidobacteria bacterium RIFCSPLOWO2_12_FULL_65_11]
MLAVLSGVDVSAQSVDAAFKRFWEARNPQEAGRAAADIVRSGVTFDEALARLKRGRPYRPDVPRGIVRLSRRSGSQVFYYDLNVPATYDPSRTYQLRVQLHGGVMGQETSQPRGDGSIGEMAGPDEVEQIYLLPCSWKDAPWWTDAQLENLRAILDSVKRTYNIDENRVVLAGVSDGATAAFYVAMRDTTLFASFLPLNGYVMVLANPSVGAEGDLYPNNFRNKPFFIVNGGADALYPRRLIDPYIEHLTNGGVIVDYRPQPTSGHNLSWWPELKEDFEAFVRAYPRDPLPTFLTWENGGDESTNRAHWLVIDRISPTRESRQLFPDLDEFDMSEEQPSSPRLITHMGRYGRVDLWRAGNSVEAHTRGVGAFTLLLSPDAFDFAQPVKVVVDDRVVFEERVRPSLATLMKWAARDNDRTMLFGVELQIEIE